MEFPCVLIAASFPLDCGPPGEGYHLACICLSPASLQGSAASLVLSALNDPEGDEFPDHGNDSLPPQALQNIAAISLAINYPNKATRLWNVEC